jgi:methionyl-tRNA synthetase
MSKSLGNVIDPNEYIHQFGSDALRYYLMKEMPIERDGIFGHELFIECYNADLANTYGNLVSRFLGIASKHNNGVIKKGNVPMDNLSIELENAGRELITSVEDCVQSYKINELIHNVLEFAKLANKYVEETKPWVLTKENKLEHLNNFLFCLGNAIRIITSLLQPILTRGAKTMTEQMKLTKQMLDFHSLTTYELMDNHKIGNSTPIYNRIEAKK